MTTGRFRIAIGGWQERLALIVGRVIVHAYVSVVQYGYGDGEVPISRHGPCNLTKVMDVENCWMRQAAETRGQCSNGSGVPYSKSFVQPLVLGK